MKRRIAALALALVAFPATAFAGPTDPHRTGAEAVPSSSLGVPPDVAARAQKPTANDVPTYHPSLGAGVDTAVRAHLPAAGTDVAASDQQASKPGPVLVSAPAPESSDFDWGDAGIGAATAASLLGISLVGGIALRRRQQRTPAVLAG